MVVRMYLLFGGEVLEFKEFHMDEKGVEKAGHVAVEKQSVGCSVETAASEKAVSGTETHEEKATPDAEREESKGLQTDNIMGLRVECGIMLANKYCARVRDFKNHAHCRYSKDSDRGWQELQDAFRCPALQTSTSRRSAQTD